MTATYQEPRAVERGPAYRLVRAEVADVPAPELDPDQRAVADHRGGPLLVLAGPGTGKTTTLVEAVASRVAEGTPGDRLLVLTFSRKAAVELRDRLTLRLGSGAMPLATTFHAFAYALLRAHQSPEAFASPLRLLSGPEQDVTVRQLVAGTIDPRFVHAATGTSPVPAGTGSAGTGSGDTGSGDTGAGGAGRSHLVPWPPSLREALGTRGFADELRAVIARARELGLDPDRLADQARRVGRPDWFAAARFLHNYVEALDAQGVIDYAELMYRAALRAASGPVRADLHRRYAAVFVDEYQDTDPAQVRLLRALAGDGRDLVAFGDPDQSIYAFRGADITGILDFPTAFPQLDGEPAPVRVLRTSRRAGAGLLASTRILTRRMPIPRLDADAVRAHRALVPAAARSRAGSAAQGRVQVLLAATAGAERDTVVDTLRRAHLEDGVPWGEMAVLVRSGPRSIPALRRALASAGVPVEAVGVDLPVAAEAAVGPLLQALACAADPSRLTAEAARSLLLSPLGGADPTDLRRLGRALRAEERQAASREAGDGADDHTSAGPGGDMSSDIRSDVRSDVGGGLGVRPSEQLVREAVAEPERLVAIEDRIAAPALRLGKLLAAARRVLDAEGPLYDALWKIWSGGPWPDRLERAALRGGSAGRSADRDLDAVCVLFDLAARAEDRAGRPGVADFLAELTAEQIVGDTLVERPFRGDVVRVMTAHRSKGLEWRLVVVAGAQEGLWPDLRRRGSLLDADRIGADGLCEPLPASAILAEERRLLYVAATRASERLVVTAVREIDEDGDQPSRFVSELGVEPVEVHHRSRRPLSMPALVADLRATLVAAGTPEPLRLAAAERLARLARERDSDGLPLVPAADPMAWWGVLPLTDPGVPVRPRDRPLQLSGSSAEGLHDCPLRWFLSREVRADTPQGPAASFGNVIHIIADEVATGDLPSELPVLLAKLDDVWDALAFEAPWKSSQEKDEARAALERFLTWHATERHRIPVASEHEFEVDIKVGTVELTIRGSMDRVEADRDGVAYVVDFKTGRTVPTKREVDEHVQLAVYQLVARSGALDRLDLLGGETPPTVGGAELVQLRHGASAKAPRMPKVQAQGVPEPDADGRTWIEKVLAQVAARVLDERFHAKQCTWCSMCEYRRCCPRQPEGGQVVE